MSLAKIVRHRDELGWLIAYLTLNVGLLFESEASGKIEMFTHGYTQFLYVLTCWNLCIYAYFCYRMSLTGKFISFIFLYGGLFAILWQIDTQKPAERARLRILFNIFLFMEAQALLVISSSVALLGREPSLSSAIVALLVWPALVLLSGHGSFFGNGAMETASRCLLVVTGIISYLTVRQEEEEEEEIKVKLLEGTSDFC